MTVAFGGEVGAPPDEAAKRGEELDEDRQRVGLALLRDSADDVVPPRPFNRTRAS